MLPTASDLGLLEVDLDTVRRGEDAIVQVGDVAVLERPLATASGLDWVLHLRAPVEALAPAQAHSQFRLVALTGLSLVLSGLVILMAVRYWRPARDALQRSAMDPLTGLANRAELDRAGAALLAAAARDGHRALVVTLDLDNFKCLNDTHGHDRGDAAIVAVADAFRSATRARDISARTGGDEFVVVMRLSSRADPAAIAARLRAHVAHTIVTEVPEARDVGVDVTLGYACTAEHGYEPRGTPHRSRWGARRRQGGPERPCLRRVPAPSIGHLSAYGDTSPQHGRC
ncbi:hypothetical protein GCM10025876_34270 [Demequina litorisediminis]|uniref:GGDEF domain-containing protein n=2 Tax=Demequina litorisediminis TaxID=1849022 RepID=A0ABQ6IH69_9MICO|nr:hypothetical protein GCM10025876_34270 [Demequina litorisediminis]